MTYTLVLGSSLVSTHNITLCGWNLILSWLCRCPAQDFTSFLFSFQIPNYYWHFGHTKKIYFFFSQWLLHSLLLLVRLCFQFQSIHTFSVDYGIGWSCVRFARSWLTKSWHMDHLAWFGRFKNFASDCHEPWVMELQSFYEMSSSYFSSLI